MCLIPGSGRTGADAGCWITPAQTSTTKPARAAPAGPTHAILRSSAAASACKHVLVDRLEREFVVTQATDRDAVVRLRETSEP